MKKRPSARRVHPPLPPLPPPPDVRTQAVQVMVADIVQGAHKTLPKGKREAIATLIGGRVTEDSMKVAEVVMAIALRIDEGDEEVDLDPFEPISRMLFLNGSETSYRCGDCGSNVFTEYAPGKYRCNGCDAAYTSN